MNLDELIYASKKARDKYIDAENESDEELEKNKQLLIKLSKTSEEIKAAHKKS
jgi:hypothetical protein